MIVAATGRLSMLRRLKDSSTKLSWSGRAVRNVDLEDRETRAAEEARLEIEDEGDDELDDGEELDEELDFDPNGGHAYSSDFEPSARDRSSIR